MSELEGWEEQEAVALGLSEVKIERRIAPADREDVLNDKLADFRLSAVDAMLYRKMGELEAKYLGSLTRAATTSNSLPLDPPDGSNIVDRIREALMFSRAPKETWVSSRMFPADRAMRLEGEEENITAAGPAFWLKVRTKCRDVDGLDWRQPTTTPQAFMGVPIVELDPSASDPPDGASRKRDELRRVVMAFAEKLFPFEENRDMAK